MSGGAATSSRRSVVFRCSCRGRGPWTTCCCHGGGFRKKVTKETKKYAQELLEMVGLD